MQFLKMRQKHYGTEVLVNAGAIVSLEDAGGYTLIFCAENLQYQVVETLDEILQAMMSGGGAVFTTTVAQS